MLLNVSMQQNCLMSFPFRPLFPPRRYDVPSRGSKPSALIAELQQHFDPELQEWLLREMAENRDKVVAAKKVSIAL